MIPKGYRVKVTASGYIFILTTIVLGLGAINTGNNLLYLIASLLLALMILSGLGSFGNLFFLDIDIIPSQEIFAGIPSRFSLIIHKRRGNSFFLSCETRFGAAQLPMIAGQLDTTLWLTFPERGKTRIETVRIHSGFPLGFVRRFKLYAAGLDVMVYPRPFPQVLPPLTGNSLGMAPGASFHGELSDETKDLRDYIHSDPLKWVDWKATARKGNMVVRELYRFEGDTLILDLSKRVDGWEKRLSEACYLILQCHRKELSVALILPDREIGAGRGEKHKKLLLEGLSLA
jgi:uncharacterized protein (DUF58 family)